ncbi:MAG: hypothetical protein RBU37_01520 [Myxococcota bacterium]|nr:hypothetical protein [Myxococcota bacterium]
MASLIRSRDAKVRWLSPEHLFLVLRRAASVALPLIAHVKDGVEQVASSVEPFVLVSRGVGVYPEGARPRVIHAGTAGGREQVEALTRALDEALLAQGIPMEHGRHVAQVVLGRLCTPRKRLDLSDAVEALRELPLGSSEVRELVLFETRARRSGMQVKVLSRHLLRGVQAAGVQTA